MPARMDILPTLSPDELAQLPLPARQMEAWHQYVAGSSFAAIARTFDISRGTVGEWLNAVAADRFDRGANIERETERIVAMYEAAALVSFERAESVNASNPASMAGPQHMKNFLDAVEKLAKLRGIDAPKAEGPTGKRVTEVVVRIGGRPGVEFTEHTPIEVGVRETAELTAGVD